MQTDITVWPFALHEKWRRVKVVVSELRLGFALQRLPLPFGCPIPLQL